MGSQESKTIEEPPKQKELEERDSKDSLPSTPILTPLDPRSPSSNIARTPLELVLGSKTSNEDINVTEDGSMLVTKNVILNVDPRSPSAEFNRTPIIVSTVIKENPSKLNNKNLDNVRKSTIQTTPITSTKKSTIIPPKLLGSSPISVNPTINKRRSLVGLLETNIDFTETNLDNVCKNGGNLTEELLDETVEIYPVPLTKQELESEKESLPIKSQTDSKTTCDQVHNDDIQACVINESEKIKNELHISEQSEDDLSEKVNITAHVRDFDKKLTNLIYQDESEGDDKLNIRFTKIRENIRMPLGVRNSNEEPKKPTSKLRVSDKPRKSDTSKIPVLKDIHSKKVGIQCENTPPKMTEENRVKSKLSKWDGDKTLII